MEKIHSFLRRWGSFSCEPPNLELKQLRNFANQLSEQELNQLVQQRHSWLSASLRRRTNNKLVCIKLSRLVMPGGNFQLERIFSDLATINSAQDIIVKRFWHRKPHFTSASKTCTWEFYQIPFLSEALHTEFFCSKNDKDNTFAKL